MIYSTTSHYPVNSFLSEKLKKINFYYRQEYTFPKILIRIMIKTIEVGHLVVFLLFAIPSSYRDVTAFRIPDNFSLGGIITLFFYDALFCQNQIVSSVAGGLLGLVIFLLLRLATKGLGWGDVKYAAFLGVFCGMNDIFIGLFFASLIALISVCPQIWRCRTKAFKERIPFAPFLTVGGILTEILRFQQ